MKFPRLLVASALLCVGSAAHAQAQAWSPQKNVEIIVPAAPGGTNDKLARQVERTLTTGKLVSSTMTVVNKGVDLVYGSWRVIIGPKGLSPEQVAYWENVLRKVSETAEWKAELERYYWSDYFVSETHPIDQAQVADGIHPSSRLMLTLASAYSDRTCTLRHLMGPPVAPFTPAPYWSENGPSGNLLSRARTVTAPLSITVISGTLAVISMTFHLPPARLVIGTGTEATEALVRMCLPE